MANRFLSNIKINDAYTFPASDGTNGQVIKTDGSGNLSFAQLAADSASVMYKDTFTGNGSTTAFTLANALNDEVQSNVYIDGVYQSKSTYSVSGTTLTFSTAPASSHEIEVISTTGINSGPTAIYTDTFTANGSTTAFTLAQTVHDENQTIVFLNGVYQFKGTYTLSGTTLTLDTAPSNGVAIEVMSIGSAYSGGDILYDHDFASAGLMTTNGSGVYSITANNSANWNTAYGWGDHSTQSYATQSYVGTQISNLVDSSPSTLNTLNELAAALGDDPNFATTTATNIGTKMPLAGGTFTGDIVAPGIYVGSANTSFDFYNNGTSYLNGAVTIDSNITQTGATIASFTDKVGVGTVNPYAFDTTATKLHVKNPGSSGSVVEVARFEGSSDGDGSGGVVRLTTSNDRGMYFQAGRTGTVPYAEIGTTEYNGAKTLAITLDNLGNSTFAGTIASNNIAITNSGNGELSVTRTSGATVKSIAQSARGQIGTSSNHELQLITNATSRLTISTSGNATFAGDVVANGAIQTLASNANLTISGDTSGNVYYNNTAGEHRWRANGSSVNSMTLSSSLLTVNENATFAGNVTIGTGIIKAAIGGDIAITQGAIGLRINDAASAISPTTATANNDNAVDLGVSNIRFRSLYMGGNITFGDSHFIGDDASDNLLIQSSANENIIIDSLDEMLFRINGSTKMQIKSSGNVGIGTTSPTYKLHLNNSATLTATYQKFTNGTATTGTTLGIDADGDFLINNGEAKEIKLYTNDTQRLTIQSGGNVGIGTTSPDYQLDVENSSHAVVRIHAGVNKSASLRLKNDAQDWDLNTQTTDTFAIYNQTSATQPFSILPNGNVGIGTTSPSKKLEVAGSYKLGTNAYIQYNASYPYTINMLNTASVGNLILNAGSGSSGYESKIELQGSNTAGAAGITLSTGSSPRMVVTADGRIEVAGNVLSIDNVDEYRQDFTTTGSSTPSFDIDLKSVAASGQPFEVFVAWTHYSTSHGTGLHQAYYQRSTVQSNITLIHTYFNQSSTNGGAWSVSYVDATTIRVSKSAGAHGSIGYGYIRVTRLKP